MWTFLAFLLGRLLHAYARLCFATSRYEVTAGAERTLRRTWDAGVPTVYVFWHDEFLILSLNACCRRIQFPSCVTNDSFGGRLVASFWKSAGAEVVTIGLRETREARIARTLEALRAEKRLVIAADYGKPWFRPRPTAVQLASAAGGVVVAMHLAGVRRAALRIGSWRLELPLPFNRYSLHLSEPMRPDGGITPAAITAKLAGALFGLRRRASAPSGLEVSSSARVRLEIGNSS
jgi:lysophospholipid acyltransferase (LPLAT)-like uncharacterized protein